jgi:hypothetical protein
MFPVESYPPKVLFDTGATHSFISTSWVESHNIPIEPMICNALNLGVEFFFFSLTKFRCYSLYSSRFASFFPISNQYSDRCPRHV